MDYKLSRLGSSVGAFDPVRSHPSLHRWLQACTLSDTVRMAFLNRGQASEAKMLASILVLVRGLGRTWAHSIEKTLMCRKDIPFCIQIDCSSRRHGSRKVQLETLEFFARWGCPVKIHNVALAFLPIPVLSLSPFRFFVFFSYVIPAIHFSSTFMTISVLHEPF